MAARITVLAVAVSALGGCAAIDAVTGGGSPSAPATRASGPGRPSQTPPPPPIDTLDVTHLPGYVAPEQIAPGQWRRPLVGGEGSITWSLADARNVPLTSAPVPSPRIDFDPATYTTLEGVTTLRGGPARAGGAWGAPAITANRLDLKWSVDIGARQALGETWPGAGWTGQPLLVHWPAATRAAMGFPAALAAKDLVEVLYPVFEGKVYRLDLETGKPTRDPIQVDGGFKGTGTVDPRGYPLLYAGEGLPGTGPMHYRFFDLIANTPVAALPGADPIAPRRWGAFDSSGLVFGPADTLFEPGENGVIYRVKLGAAYDPTTPAVQVNPEATKLVYTTTRSSRRGIESSFVAYRNLLYASDNDGNLLCLDANTMMVVWARSVDDDGDATMAIEHTADGVFLYTGNEIDHRTTDPTVNLRKIDALTGEIVWQHDVPAVFNSHSNPGLLGSPNLITGADGRGLVLFNVSMTTTALTGRLLALDRATGAPVWQRDLDAYSWASPLMITGQDGRTRGVFGGFDGVIRLFDPTTGQDLDTYATGAPIESTAAAYGNTIVVASRDQKIYALTLS